MPPDPLPAVPRLTAKEMDLHEQYLAAFPDSGRDWTECYERHMATLLMVEVRALQAEVAALRARQTTALAILESITCDPPLAPEEYCDMADDAREALRAEGEA